MEPHHELTEKQKDFLLRLAEHCVRCRCFTWKLWRTELICVGDPSQPRMASVPRELVFYHALQNQGYIYVSVLDSQHQMGIEPERAEIEVLQTTVKFAQTLRERENRVGVDGTDSQETGMPKRIKAFVSYSWDSDEHKQWVRELATQLRHDGIETILDQWQLVPGDQLTHFMECAVRDSEYVLIVCTQAYKRKSDQRIGGAGYEGDIMSAEVLSEGNHRKFIPILREQPSKLSLPTWLQGKLYINLTGSPHQKDEYRDLLTTLLGTRTKAPPVLPATTSRSVAIAPASSEKPSATESAHIQITKVLDDQIGTPRGDGTRGSALYSVPFRLSRTPSRQWAALLVNSWDHPPRFTTMHRPGIASVVGDTIVLNGTTIEEVKDYHRETLILAVQEANRKLAEMEQAARIAAEQEARRLLEHKRNVEEKAKGITFDD